MSAGVARRLAAGTGMGDWTLARAVATATAKPDPEGDRVPAMAVAEAHGFAVNVEGGPARGTWNLRYARDLLERWKGTHPDAFAPAAGGRTGLRSGRRGRRRRREGRGSEAPGRLLKNGQGREAPGRNGPWPRMGDGMAATMTFEDMARANGWEVTLNHRDEYVAHDVHPDSRDAEPVYILDADDEGEAWEELCKNEGIDHEGFGGTEPLDRVAADPVPGILARLAEAGVPEPEFIEGLGQWRAGHGMIATGWKQDKEAAARDYVRLASEAGLGNPSLTSKWR